MIFNLLNADGDVITTAMGDYKSPTIAGFIGRTIDGQVVASLEDATPGPTDEELAAEAREERDALLSATDYLFYTDAPYSEDTVALYRTYRQELRDVPQQEGFPQTIVWPERP